MSLAFQCRKMLISIRVANIYKPSAKVRFSIETAIRKSIKSLEQLQFLTKGLGDSEIIRTFASLEPAKPLNDAQMCGSFYNLSVMTDEIYLIYYNPILSGHLIGHL